MSRNMIAANTRIFSRLASSVGELDVVVASKPRAIRTDPSDKKWLKDVEFKSSKHLSFGSGNRFSIAHFDGDTYLVTIGVKIKKIPAGVERVVPSPGLITAAIADLTVSLISVSDLRERLLEYVFFPSTDAREFYEAELIASFFLPIDVFRIEKDSALLCDDAAECRIGLVAALCAPDLIALPWPEESLALFQSMAYDESEKAPFNLLLRALTDTRDDSAFLSTYRCLEQLFPIPKLTELSVELSISLPALRFADAIERHLGWRRREEEAITHLFSELDQGELKVIGAAFGIILEEEKKPKALAKRVYDSRNRCVHFRPSHAFGSEESEPDWLALATSLLQSIRALYQKYSGAFGSANK